MVSKQRFTYSTGMVLIALVSPIFAGSSCKCKGAPTPPPDTESDNLIQDISVKLQVSTVDPGEIQANEATDIAVYGGGFEQGASVRIGAALGTDVVVEDSSALSVKVPSLVPGTYDVTVTNVDGTSSSLRRGLTVRSGVRADCTFLRVHFDFDKAALDEASRVALDDKMSCFQETSAKIRIEGHTDERGTVDYNLSLGQRRAEAVRRYFDASGIPDYRMNTVSFGKERPVDSGHNEASWAKNRRVDIHANQ